MRFVSNSETDIIIAELNHYQKEMKVSKNEFEQRKDLLCEGYLLTNQELVTVNGILLATWKFAPRKSFNQEAFKTDHPELFAQYQVEKDIRTFLLK
jgi:hypothetical protein